MSTRLDRPLKVLVDVFHAASNGEDVPAFLRAHPGQIAHLHLADFPNRHEPGTGQIDFFSLAQALKDIGFTGALGLEYSPAGDTLSGLNWRSRWPNP